MLETLNEKVIFVRRKTEIIPLRKSCHQWMRRREENERRSDSPGFGQLGFWLDRSPVSAEKMKWRF
jgi:hypothetical protein